jgi:hypothetical protein
MRRVDQQTCLAALLLSACGFNVHKDEVDATPVVQDLARGLGPSLCGDAAPSRCAALSVDECVNFESGIPANWPSMTVNGSAEIDGMHVCRGLRALHLYATSGSAQVDVHDGQTFANGLSTVWVRLFAYQPGPLSATRTTFAYVSQASAPFGGIAVGADSGSLFVYDSMAAPATTTSTTPFPPDRWNCLELAIAPGETRVWLDDTEVSDLHLHVVTEPSPPLSVIAAGVSDGQRVPPDVWLDEIAISTHGYIECAQ